MGNPYTTVAVTNYNVNPPSDDGTQTGPNTVEWDKHKTKHGDPLKVAIEATQTNITAAFAARLLNDISTTTIDHTITTAERGTIVQVNSASNRTITLPVAATAQLGFEIIIANINTGTATIDADGTETVAGSQTIELPPNTRVWLVCDGVSNWVIAVRDADFALPRGQLSGLGLSNNGTDAQHDLDIAPGQAIDITNAEFMVLSAIMVKRIDASWAAGTNQGGFPTALTLSADTTYHVFVIRDRVASVVDVGFDTSLSAANLLADAGDYTQYRRIGSILTDASSNITAFFQDGDSFLWDLPVMDEVGTTKTTAATLHTLSVPVGVSVGANVAVMPYQQVFSTGGVQGLVTSPLQADTAPTASLFNMRQTRQVANYSNNLGYNGIVITDTSARIRTRWTAATGHQDIMTLGWTDRRGRDA